jgi:hypothetical protein
MPEPLIRSEHLVGSWDPDAGGWSARDFVAGPAGSAGIDLPGGVEVDVDVASPGTLVSLWAPSGDGTPAIAAGETRFTLEVLLGPERMNELLTLGAGPPRILRSGNSRPERSNLHRRGSFPGSQRDGVDGSVARLALALDIGDDASASPLARALASLDAALAAAEVSEPLDLDASARRHAAEAADLLLAVVREGALKGAAIPERRLADALRSVFPLLVPVARAAMRDLANDIDAGRFDLLTNEKADGEPDDVYAAAMGRHSLAKEARMPATSVRTSPARILDAIDLLDVPELFARARLAARATSASEIEVRIHDRAADAVGWWARAFAPGDIVVAAAPLRAVGADAVARLLVPPATLRSVEIDITGEPGDPRPGPGTRAIVDAVSAGRSAARAERLGSQPAIRRRWRSTAEAWSQAGDLARAGLAADYSRGVSGRRDTDRVPGPLLGDALAESET